MRFIALVTLCLLGWNTAKADEAAQCQAGNGTFLTGRVVADPHFARGRHPLHGIELSHTHVTLLSDRDGQSWDVAVDDVFAAGYDAAGETVPAPLSTIRVGSRIEVCGRPFHDSDRQGVDWVHTNCGAAPTTRKPNGWLKILGPNGAPGPNLEASLEYCRLWR
ncbi:MAG TPA: hypothetical protein VGF97_10240 [Rhizomicrobium sp.]|jgi:hypothetical protein